MNMKKLIAALLVLTMLLSAVSCLATYYEGDMVYFKSSCYGYKSHNARHKTKTIVSKGSWSVCTDDQNGNWVPVAIHKDGSSLTDLWFNKKYLDSLAYYPWIVKGINEGNLPLIGIRYGSGGGGRSAVYVDPDTGKYVVLDNYKEGLKHVEATGKCNIREFAGLTYKTFGTLKKGKTLKFKRYSIMDTRGVFWHAVVYKGETRFVSSLYTKVVK